MIERATKRLTPKNFSNLKKICKANAEDLKEFDDNSFTHYIASYVLHLVPDATKMAKEALRITKPGFVNLFNILSLK